MCKYAIFHYKLKGIYLSYKQFKNLACNEGGENNGKEHETNI
jgi:hypothetical protein